MADQVPRRYQEMVQEALREGEGNERPLKRRKRHGEKKAEVGDLSEEEVAEVTRPERKAREEDIEPQDVDDVSDSDDDYEQFDSDEFEDVDLDVPVPEREEKEEKLNISVRVSRPQKKKVTRVSKEEREFRRTFHMLYLFTMVGHGVCRNAWCSDPALLESLRTDVPQRIIKEYRQYLAHRERTDVTTQSKTRRFLDLLKRAMVYWYSSWTLDTDAAVIGKKGWDEIGKRVKCKKITKKRFRRYIEGHSGSRDIAAQGFVSLLRSIGVQARLVFSLQPPDFTDLVPVKEQEEGTTEEAEKRNKKPAKPKKSRAKVMTQQQRLLNNLRGRRNPYNNFRESESTEEETERLGKYPVFWCEVWDKDAKKFITIDPVVQKTIEVVRGKSKLEPPGNYKDNNAYYVVGYDRLGGVRDITRRYAEQYNAKVRKKRITRDEEGEKWWDSLLRGATTKRRLKPNKMDQFEKIEFEELSLKEGMPNSIQDFKNHPIYVLEDQLKANEVLKPKVSCGTVRKRTKNNSGVLIPVYKRDHVCTVRSAKAWYMRGRVLKIGQRALKVKERTKKTEEDEDDVRLYAEYQTEQFVPPVIENGEIPRNVYGNIDVYKPWMVPEGCVHVAEEQAEKAAKLMGIEYAPAAVGFDFNDRKASATVRINGVVTFDEYEEAVRAVAQGLREYEEDKARRREDLIALRAWKVMLTKMRIVNRLNEEHGEVVEESESQSGRESEYEGGGFIPGEMHTAPMVDSEVDENMSEGGFEVENEDAGGNQTSGEEDEFEDAQEGEEYETETEQKETEPVGEEEGFDDFMKEIGLDEDVGEEREDAGGDAKGDVPEPKSSPEVVGKSLMEGSEEEYNPNGEISEPGAGSLIGEDIDVYDPGDGMSQEAPQEKTEEKLAPQEAPQDEDEVICESNDEVVQSKSSSEQSLHSENESGRPQQSITLLMLDPDVYNPDGDAGSEPPRQARIPPHAEIISLDDSDEDKKPIKLEGSYEEAKTPPVGPVEGSSQRSPIVLESESNSDSHSDTTSSDSNSVISLDEVDEEGYEFEYSD